MFLERLVELIGKKGISKNKLLLETGINTNAFQNWEKRGTVPSGDVVAKIADYFNVSTDYLLGRTDAPEKKPAPEDEGGPSEAAQRFMPLVDRLTPDQQQLLLTQIQAWIGQNESLASAAPQSSEGKAPGFDP